jgi:hypothetical protein
MSTTGMTRKQCETFLETLQESANHPKYAPTVQVIARDGGKVYHPLNPAAKAFATLLNRPDGAIPESALTTIEALGYVIEQPDGKVIAHPIAGRLQ